MNDQTTAEPAPAAESEYTCARCNCKEPLPHQGRTINGAIYCINCSLEMTKEGASSQVREETAEQVERIESQQEKQAKKDRSPALEDRTVRRIPDTDPHRGRSAYPDQSCEALGRSAGQGGFLKHIHGFQCPRAI